jgi:hypothetical protein
MKMERVAPVFPTRDVRAALERYRRLGFDARAHEEAGQPAPIYGFLSRDGVQLHLSRAPGLDPKTSTSVCYLYVDDADRLYTEWKAAKVEGHFGKPEDKPYGLREFGYVDPDGNLLRVGSQLKAP